VTAVSSGTQRLEWRTGLLFDGEDSRGYHLPVSGDPELAGAKPSDLLPLSLAACLAYDVVVVLRKKRQDLRRLTAVVQSEQEDVAPQRFTRIDVRFEVAGRVEVAAAVRALELAQKNCPVLASIASGVDVAVSIVVTGD
jgi:putative redox protein